ncbi:hypothetical protein PHYSODRAFT_552059 [Phytophthora sojae]|uniref:PDZ domain-containing protein n=1 Tax=Phytophthora sojae (strain P6497) TaxID=1094619 RepID=G4YPM7_PHYSP|nr:hypothetical protein PHYSODRAFT_552059 [Phytophthora sojae]EGZ28329.1 hypothetical protein PHYSODRAFT_552059 [Phytophthora sojae]|eukprot:XP_009515604.1 hypothetical protein PHYSODRAFT_552059 [Phytophthora sojae]
MATRAEVPPPAPASLAPETTPQEPQSGDKEFFVLSNLVGVELRCVVNPKWPCEALLGAAAEAYQVAFPNSEVPECNVVFHRKKQEFLVAGTPIIECCANRDELELGVTLPARASANVDDAASVAPSSVSGVDSDGETSEFCVLFHKLPLGFTMKRGHDGNTEVGTIYPKSAATHFPRLTPGVTIVSIAGTPLKDMGLRQVHDLIKNAELPLEIHFRGPELAPSLTPGQQEASLSRLSGSAGPPPTHPQQGGRRRGSFDRRSVRSSGSNGSGRSRNSRSSGRGRKKSGEVILQQGGDNQQKGEGGKMRVQAGAHTDASDSNQRGGPEEHEADKSAEAELVEQIEQLKVALLRKHEEAKQIARQLEMCSEKLLALRGESAGAVPRGQQQQQKQQSKQNGTPRLRRSATSSSSNGGSKVRLTPEVLEAMDQKAGLPRRGTGAYTSSNVSSISGYSAQSMPAARSASMRARSARAAALANADNVSVSSYTSNSSNTSARRGGSRSPRGTALRNLNKRYNYMPQKYAANTTGASEGGSTSLSSRGAVMSRARISRDSFITKSESPGVGYYDVQVKDRVKGGEIGDSDRSLPWS